MKTEDVKLLPIQLQDRLKGRIEDADRALVVDVLQELITEQVKACGISPVSDSFSLSEMESLGHFIRDNYYGVGAPKLISYDTSKRPHSDVKGIVAQWQKEYDR